MKPASVGNKCTPQHNSTVNLVAANLKVIQDTQILTTRSTQNFDRNRWCWAFENYSGQNSAYWLNLWEVNPWEEKAWRLTVLKLRHIFGLSVQAVHTDLYSLWPGVPALSSLMNGLVYSTNLYYTQKSYLDSKGEAAACWLCCSDTTLYRMYGSLSIFFFYLPRTLDFGTKCRVGLFRLCNAFTSLSLALCLHFSSFVFSL